jgi:NAD(P)-dependent dehydrogenase (short-subunit alcohol dehydrogenase family)
MNDSSPLVILVTGASSGIGHAAVLSLLAAGHRVHAGARRTERMTDLVFAGAVVHHLDVADDLSRRNCCETILGSEGRIDVLINNAGFGVYGAVEDVSLADARAQFETNLFGLAHLTQIVLPQMRQRGSGCIINLGSVGGTIHTPMGAWYHASKFALEGWTRCLRLEVEPHGIRVIQIIPGAIQTEFGEVAMTPLLTRAEGGAYQTIAHRMARAVLGAYASGTATSPEKVGRLLAKLVIKKHPHSRYVIGHLAWPLLLMRRVLSDRMIDRIMRRFM